METLHPGLYFQEIAGISPVGGASTSTGAFVGTAPKGKIGEAVLVTNWTQFVKEFGGFDKNSYLAYAVRGFFENGGSRAYISRVVHYAQGVKSSAPATADLSDAQSTITIKVQALYDGAYGNTLAVGVTNVDSVANSFDLAVVENGTVVETYTKVKLEEAEDITKNSAYIKLTVVGTTLPAVVADKALAGGNDGLTGLTDTDYIGDANTRAGLYAFDNVDINLVAIPAITSEAVVNGLITYVEGRQDCFAIVDVPFDMNVTQAKDFVVETAKAVSEYAGIYYPFIEVTDPIGVGKNPTKFVPPSGHIMGVFARIDNSAGVWKAPAGTDANVLGVLGLKYNVSDAEQDLLNPVNINCLRAFDGAGICVWGTRTLSSGEYKYVPVRRTMLFIEKSLKDNMRWTVFKPNDEKLWGMIKSTIESFLTTIWSQGGLKGTSSTEAFFVKCDAELNTPDVVDQGRTYVDIGIAPQKPAEFIIFRLSLKR